MERIYDVVDSNGNELKASIEEIKENNYTILATNMSELKELVDDGINLSIDLGGSDYTEDASEIIFSDEEDIPEDPSEGDEGYDDKSIYKFKK